MKRLPFARSGCAFFLALVLVTSCSRPAEKSAETREPAPEAPKSPEPPKPDGPALYRVRFETSKGPFVVEVHRDWAPLGAERFEELIEDKFFDGARFFRVVPNFIVQFGLAANPAKTKKWDKAFKDDAVKQTNRLGSITFATAGPETRTSQLFINLRSNQTLDQQGFAPFGQVVEGMEIVEKLYAAYGERPDQAQITQRGNAYLIESFPQLDYIRTARIVTGSKVNSPVTDRQGQSRG